ncbi:beta strand repeat-containing protein [Occallatibacter riparius]|uniref:Ig-like domain repeat protein n=1 Tax=Occallatibacter riparius TaxID=1002689 RepID=A0A9J7BU05_9BACT|nr:Ig-like domain repeat protein [Occallatibacter riparius]UWZ86119.1 Ig-like domain repeat protein [Occallatibacter riparius]
MSSLVRCVLPARFVRLSLGLLALTVGALLLPSQGHASCSTVGNVTTCTGGSISLSSTLNASAGSSATVSGLGTVSAISITLNNVSVSGTSPGGLNSVAMVLVSPGGTALDFLSGVCNSSTATFSVADTGINGTNNVNLMMPYIGSGSTCPSALGGTYYASDWFPGLDTFSSPGPGTSYLSGGNAGKGGAGTANLASAFGLPGSSNMNGTWTLYVANQATPVGTGSIGSWSISFTTIAATATTTSLSTSPNGASSIVYTNKNVHGDSTTGTNVTLTATVSPDPGGGTVNFYDSTGTNPGQGTLLASSVAVSGGVAQTTVTLSTEGNRSISAVYSGNSSYATSTSTKANVLTTNHPYSPSSNVFCNGPITINNDPGNDPNSGAATPYASLMVLDKNQSNIGTIAGTIQSVSVSLNGINLTNGTVLQDLGFLLQAPGSNTSLIGSSGNAFEFLGWGGNPYTSGSLTISDSGSAQVPFDAAPSCSTCLPTDNYVDNGPTNIDSFPPPAPTPTGKAAPTGSDTFLTQFGGQGANNTWSLFTADRLAEVTPLGSIASWCLNFSMQANAHPTTTTMTSSANPAQFTAVNNTGKATITLTATVTSDQTVNAGSVTFVDGSTSLGSATVVNGVATLSNAQLNEGTHEITATYGGTNTGTEFGVSTYKYVERVNANTVPTSGSGAGPYVYCNPGAITAPGLNADAGAAYPYPSNIFVTNLPGTVAGTSVTYSAFNTKDQAALMSLVVGPSTNSNKWNNHFDFFSLTGSAWNGIGGLPTFTPTFIDGGTAIGSTTLSTTGNYAPESFENLTFPQCPPNAADCGTQNVGPPLGTSSTFTPTNKANGSTFFGNAGQPGIFGGTSSSTYNANGTWSLYLDDGGPLGGGEPTNLTQGWCVNFTINQPVVAPSTSHSGNGIGGDFIQGEQGGQITVDVANDGPGSTGDPTGNSPMTVTDTFSNSDLTFNGSVGNGTDWTCTATGTPQTVTCKNHDSIAAGSNYPTLTIGVNVANNAASSYTNKVSAAGAGASSVTSGNDVITIDQAPVLAVAVSHPSNFTQGTSGEWDVTVSNTATTGRTLGTTTTVITLPANYTLAGSSATGATWGCGGVSNMITCTTTSNINGGANSKIALNVNVPDTSPTSVSTTAIAYGGGDLNHTTAGSAATSNVDTATVIQVPAAVTINSGDSQSTTILTAFASPLVATVKDAAGVTIPNYSPVSFAAATGTNGQGGTFSNSSSIISTTTGTGGAAGQVSETITANNKVGVFTVTVTAGTAQATFNSLTNLHGAPAGITAVSGTPQTTADTTSFAAPLVANVVDIGGNAVPGATVTFTAPSTGASAIFAGGVTTAITDATGNATSAALTANGTLGTYSVTASTSGLAPVSFSLTNALGAYAQLAVTMPPPVYATVPTQFTVVAEDAGGNLVSTATPTLHFTSTDSAANMPPDATLSGGIGTFTATLNTLGTWDVSATDATNSFTGTASNINVLAIPILVVTTAADDSASPLASNCTQQAAAGTGTDSSCSLRDALLEAAALDAANISFDTAKLGSSISINAGSTLTVPANTNIQGPATGVTVNGGGDSSDYSVFTVGTGVKASMTNFVISHGNTSGNGGGIQNMGALTVTGTTVSGNSAHAGGGIATLNPGTLTLTNSTVSGNTASANGGGIYSEGALSVTNSTIAQNTAVTHGGGVDSSAAAQVYDSTISGNTGNTGGGIAAASGTFTLANTIVAGNSAPNSADGNGTFTSGGHNVIGDGTGATGLSNGVNGDQIGTTGVPVNAALTALGNYGGTTQTMLPQPGSAAICAGAVASMPTGLATDQRGNPNINTTYLNGSNCVDAGSVQTYYAMSFTTNPPVSFNSGDIMSPSPVVTLTENGSTSSVTGTVTVADSAAKLTGTTSVNLAGGTATFGDLSTSGPVSSDKLTATLALTSSISLTADSGLFTTLGEPTLGLVVSHPGAFIQGQAAEWDVTVSDGAASRPTFGVTQLVDTLPTGYTLAGYSSVDGWTCTPSGGTITCSLSASIASGASSTIVLTVNVPADSPISVTNTAQVFGGGDPLHTSLATALTASDTNVPVQQVAASITPTGTSLSAGVTTAYSSLAVTVTDAGGVPVPGVNVIFTAPASGASGTFSNSTNTITITTDSSGAADPGTFTANTVAGPYTLVAQSGAASSNFFLDNTAGALSQILLTAPPNAFTTWPIWVTVVPEDQYGNLISGFSDSLHITSTDPAADLPPDGPLCSCDQFQVTFNTTGSQTITVVDTTNPGSFTVTSDPIIVATPPNFVVTSPGDGPADDAQCTPQPVPGVGSGTTCTLRDALNAASSFGAGNISFDNTVFSGPTTITLTNGVLEIPNDTRITGSHTGTGNSLSDLITVSGNNASGVFQITNPSSQGAIDGIGITGGAVTDSPSFTFAAGPAIYNNGTLSVDSSVISSNKATSTGSTSVSAGGAIYTDNDLEISNSNIVNNQAISAYEALGAGIYNVSYVNASNLIVSNNAASVTASNALAAGGGILTGLPAVGASAPAAVGAARTAVGSSKTAVTRLMGEAGGSRGAAKGNASAGTSTPSATATSNATPGGAPASGTIDLDYSTISNNSAAGSADHSGDAAGGGIATINGQMWMAYTTVANNSTTGGNTYGGGGLYCLCAQEIEDSTISANTADSYGGGILLDSGAAMLLGNSILSGNTGATDSDLSNFGSDLDLGGNQVGVSGINLATLSDYGGGVPTMIPLPGSPAICGAQLPNIPSGETLDERGFPNVNVTYPGYTAGNQCVDAGAVQTNYTMTFSSQPSPISPATTLDANTNFQAAVTLNESGIGTNGITIPLTLLGPGPLSGGSAVTVGGVATYSALKTGHGAPTNILKATLALNSALKLTSQSSPFEVHGPPFGAISAVKDARSQAATIAQSDNVLAEGWAVDPQSGAPVSRVQILIDGKDAGNATLGLARPDVAANTSNISFFSSGWSFTYSAAGLSLGTHTISAVAYNSLGVSVRLGVVTFTVASTSTGPPFGAISVVKDAKTGSAAVSQSDNLLVGGWAVDPQDGVPVIRVQILIDGSDAGNATLGLARPDVAAAFNNPAYLNSGWSFTHSAAGLSLGTHTISAVAYDRLGLSATLVGSVTFTVTALRVTPPFGAISLVRDARTHAATVAQSDSVMAAGWAADPQDGAPVSRVQILIDGSDAGNATLGLARPDVAAAYNNPAYLNSGWTFTYPAAGLSLGMHSISAVAYDSLGLSTTLGTVTFTVATTSIGAPFGAISFVQDAQTHASAISQSDNLLAYGWAVDPQDGAPVSRVQILIDGSDAGNATLGLARPDVATAYNNPAYLNSGWTFTYPAAGLSLGTHTVSAVGYDSLGLSATLAKVTFTVQ